MMYFIRRGKNYSEGTKRTSPTTKNALLESAQQVAGILGLKLEQVKDECVSNEHTDGLSDGELSTDDGSNVG